MSEDADSDAEIHVNIKLSYKAWSHWINVAMPCCVAKCKHIVSTEIKL